MDKNQLQEEKSFLEEEKTSLESRITYLSDSAEQDGMEIKLDILVMSYTFDSKERKAEIGEN